MKYNGKVDKKYNALPVLLYLHSRAMRRWNGF